MMISPRHVSERRGQNVPHNSKLFQKSQKSQRRMNPRKLTDQLDDPDEVDLTDGIKKQFPEERAVTFIKPVLHCES